jgi:tetratricopeptide (TPR) repeat protein
MKLRHRPTGSLIPALAALLLLAAPAGAFTAAAPGAPVPSAGAPEAVPRMESAAAQLKHATALKQALRGTSGEARRTARAAAIEGYRAVVTHFPGDDAACAEAAFRAGELLRAADETSAALFEFGRARERGAETGFRTRAALEIGHIQRRAAQHQPALEAYEAVLVDASASQRQRDDASYWAAHVYLAVQRPEDARRAWKRVAEGAEDPLDRVRAFDQLALELIDSGDLEGAAGMLERCRESLAETSMEETRLGERVRTALLAMRSVDILQRAVAERVKERRETAARK